jgi:anti-anti-sigma regulatory factor
MNSPGFDLQTIEQHAAVVRLAAADYGSLNASGVHGLFDRLSLAVRRSAARAVILDLSDVQMPGAAFLGRLPQLCDELAATAQQLIVCGDRHQLARTCRLHEVFPVLQDVSAALDWCDSRRSDSICRGSQAATMLSD